MGVKGEEELRKIILSWEKVSGAQGYEVCHNCEMDSAGNMVKGDILPIAVGRAGECGDLPCLVKPGAPIGYNTFQVRVQTDQGWSEWGSKGNFNVQEPGSVDHEEL